MMILASSKSRMAFVHPDAHSLSPASWSWFLVSRTFRHASISVLSVRANKRVKRIGVWGFRLVLVIVTSGVIAVAYPQR
jgi:hypothetical protein